MTKLFEITSLKSVIITKIFEILNSYLYEANFFINKDFLKISVKDLSEETATFIRLDSKNFELFKCNEETIVGINIKLLYKVIKSINKKDTITFYMEKDKLDVLHIMIVDSFGKTKHCRIPTLDLGKNILEIEQIDMEYQINIPSIDFQNIIKDINIVNGSFIEITSLSKQLIFECDDGNAKIKTIINEPDNIENNFTKFEKYSSEIVQGKFKLSNLLVFAKSYKLCDNMNILLSNNKPLILEYFVADLGIMRFICSPMI